MYDFLMSYDLDVRPNPSILSRAYWFGPKMDIHQRSKALTMLRLVNKEIAKADPKGFREFHKQISNIFIDFYELLLKKAILNSAFINQLMKLHEDLDRSIANVRAEIISANNKTLIFKEIFSSFPLDSFPLDLDINRSDLEISFLPTQTISTSSSSYRGTSAPDFFAITEEEVDPVANKIVKNVSWKLDQDGKDILDSREIPAAPKHRHRCF